MYTIQLSVRELVEFIYMSGDLISTSSNIERANLGSRIHRMLQSNAKGDYQSEVFLKQETIMDDICFQIEGRADGILMKEGNVTIDEIKSTSIPYDEISDQHFVHFAQAYCYGYMYCSKHQIDHCTIQLTYYQIEDKKIRVFQQEKTLDELTAFYMATLQQYLKWANLSKNLKRNSCNTLKKLIFPFEHYRPHQRSFAVAVYKTILDKDILYVQAPTGIGKTISALFPSLKAIGEQKCEKIFYLTAKNITASVAFNTLHLLYQQNVSFKTVGITAKDKICFLEKRNCDPKECPYAQGYYDRNKEALYELLCEYDFIDKEIICTIAQKHKICPFELSLDASLYADVIVCDYNYVFDPRVYLKRFFMEKGNYVFLVDEAHNLVDRAREMYSASLCKEDFLKIKRYIPKEYTPLHRCINAINKEMRNLRKECENEGFLSCKEPQFVLLEQISHFVDHMDAYLQSDHEEEHDEEIMDLYFQAINYVKISDFYDEHFVTWMMQEEDCFIIKQFCMNPCNPLRGILEKGRATIFFSATLSPIDYFLSLLGGDDTTKRLSLPSPFHKEQVKIIINDAISTKYRNRQSSLCDIIETIYACVLPKQGNYIIFTPSYAYMHQIADAFHAQYPDISICKQNEAMKEEEKQDFLKQFETIQELHLYFCVLGGMFSEGIDLKGERLIGAIIIGVGLPQINPQQDLIREHFDEINQMGYAYAYQFPGMNKVLQAAGRVIRSSNDKGMIVLVDERFTTRFYQGLLPKHMQHYEIIRKPQQIYLSLTKFWNN